MNMDKKEKILAEVDKTLKAFDNDIILEANPFLYTRLSAAHNSGLQKSGRAAVLRYKMPGIVALLVLLINLITLVYTYENREKESLQDKLIIELKSDLQIEQSSISF